jgi:hypothetical protein
VESSTPDGELDPVVDLAARYCWVTNTIRNPPEIRYHLGAPEQGTTNAERGA